MKHSIFFYRTLANVNNSILIARELLADNDFVNGRGFETFGRFNVKGQPLPYREKNSKRNGKPQHPKPSASNDKCQDEEYIAMGIFNQSKANGNIPNLGIVLDYQTPLAGTGDHVIRHQSIENALGEHKTAWHMCIDLIAYDGHTNEMRILELKKKSSKEPLLRSVVEGYTYLQVLDKDAFYKNMRQISDEYAGLYLPEEMPVFKAYPLLFSGSTAEAEYREAVKSNNELMQLMNALDVHPIFIEGTDGKYQVN